MNKEVRKNLETIKEAGDAVGEKLNKKCTIDLRCPSSREEKRTPQEVYQSIKEDNKKLFEYFDNEEIIKAEAVGEIILNTDEKWVEREMKFTIRYRVKDKELAERKFTEKDLVSFGEYLLSTERTKHFTEHYNEEDNISLDERLAEVYDADLKNWYDKQTRK